MMNLLAVVGLLIAALAASGVSSSIPDHEPHDPDSLLLEGHRLIVTEYERQVPIDPSNHQPQPPPADHHDNHHQLIQSAKDKFREAASLLPNVGQGISTPPSSQLEGVIDVVDGTKEAGNLSSAAVKAVRMAATAAAANLRKNLTDIIRRVRDVGRDTAAYVVAPGTVRAVAAAGHLVAVAVAYGACVWVTFVSSHVLARALPRQQFGMVQSKLYPAYFRVVACGLAAALVGHFHARDWRAAAERVQGYNLMAALGLLLANMLYLEPKATRVMFKRTKMEKEIGSGVVEKTDVVLESTVVTTATAARKVAAVDQEAMKNRVVKLSKRLKRLNTYSSLLNVLTLMGLTWHLMHLARCLQFSR